MDRIVKGEFQETNDPALFEIAVDVDNSSPIVAIELAPSPAGFDSDRTTFNLFGICLVANGTPSRDRQSALPQAEGPFATKTGNQHDGESEH